MATIYIQNFDQSSQLSTLGKITYDADGSVSSTNGELNLNISVDTLKAAFKFKSDGNDVSEETAQAQFNNNSTLLTTTYDDMTEVGTPTPPVDFVQQLAKEVFGSTSAVDLFSNEDDVAQGVKNAIIACNEAVNAIPTSSRSMANDQPGDEPGSANPTSGDGVAGGQPGSEPGTVLENDDDGETDTTGALGALDVLNALLAGFESRFELAYTVSGTISATGDLTEQSATSYFQSDGETAGNGDGALRLNFNFNSAGDTVEQVTVHTAGSGYEAGDILTFSDGNTNSITVTLRDTDLNAINGASNFVEMPIEAEDKLQMIYTISSADGQKDASDDDCSVERTYLLQITAN